MSLTWLDHLRRQQIIAVIRTTNLAAGLSMAQAVAAAGIEFIEITWNSTDPAQLLTQVRATLPHCVVGCGTLMTVADLRSAIAASAQFCFTPHTHPDLIHHGCQQGIPIIPGALSPTEIVTAWQAGATAIKIFPAQCLGGATYIQALQGPLGQIPLIPTGGVTLANAAHFLNAGAIAVGLAGDLFPPALVQNQDWEAITARARALRQHLRHQDPGHSDPED
ncbi:bifunctional 4-hydroxy-2-oxoglutarate aldolase/2-dehydro-3-deoxy-phosphogluconate aldolase [Synechococcales cyanobacterium C]|uniref:Bifunctional 4-hydroxy-2-oxoglutarate aldolase/2-dehydro-3-deoxy-phosphogluconate aldolase n=1 Tax=Petrachloros mirabilis ULC683 TaxID=2781853 RepID=A0A8K2AC31_9CYAN|nr:bifunctional 4-hydroxy-2-oxoglutarate aldolase/2-dehydro-3-deoxy-phosphogluconate aldolase [Petrachloros mirabilis ULC683]